jgi:hypothetical protein
VDRLDREIRELEGRLPVHRTITRQAHRVEQEGQQEAQTLQNMHQGVQQRTQERQQRGQQEAQRVQSQNSSAEQQATSMRAQSGSNVQRAGSQLAPIASMARTADGLAQRVPENRWVNVTGVKNNIHQFREGIDQVSGSGQEHSQQTQQAASTMNARNQAVTQAAQHRANAASAGQNLQQRIQSDRAASQNAAQSAQAAAQQSQQQEQTTEQQLQQKRQEREGVWNTLLGWAANHREVRTAEMARVRGGH